MRKAMVCCAMLFLVCSICLASDWPQEGGNPQRTNFTPDSPAPEYKPVWAADFRPELIYSAQPVIAGGRVFQTTLQGNLYALDDATGGRLWHFKAGRCMWSGAAAGTPQWGGAGKVFVAAWDGFIYGLDAATGAELWRFDAGETISGSPCIAEDTLFIAGRRGTVFALSTAGELKWKTPVSWNVYSSVAWDAGRVYAVSEDMYVHCLAAGTGEKIWTSDRMSGMVMREFYPVIHKGKVLVAVTPSVWQHDPGGPAPFVMGWGGWGIDAQQAKEAWAKYDPILQRGEMPPEFDKLQQQIIDFYRETPQYQSLYVFNAADGKQAYNAVHHYGSAGLQNTVKPPVVCGDGAIISGCVYGGGSGLARLDLEKNRWNAILLGMGSATDESCYASAGGSRVFTKTTMGTPRRMFDLDTYTLHNAGSTPDRSLGRSGNQISVLPETWQPAWAFSSRRLGGLNWHGEPGGMSPIPISGKRFYWMQQVQVLVAYEGE